MSPEKPAAESLVGAVLEGAYRIEGLLGEGGMATVYKATHLRLGKRVAVKVMARELASNTEALARFHREAQVTSGLGHPHIVQVFDFSTTPNGEPFLVMELLEGEDLDRRLRTVGRLPAADVVRLVQQVASALAATHAKNIIHRDLKPANICLLDVAGETNFVKVVDFGISKVRSATTKLTQTSAVIGTPNYMSPEQANGLVEDIDERTDQWALACIAWECLSGEGPFVGESVPSILFRVVHAPPAALLPKVAGLHPKVEDVLLRALAKNKEDRFATVNDFATAFARAVAGIASAVPVAVPRTAEMPALSVRSVPSRPSTFTHSAGQVDDIHNAPGSRPKWIWAMVASAAVIMILGALLLIRRGPATQKTAASPLPIAPALPAPPNIEPPVVPQVEPRVQTREPERALPEPIPEPKTKRAEQNLGAKAAAGDTSDGARSKKRRLTKKPGQENQEIWRVD